MRRLLLGCGSRHWPDLARAASELALYPRFELMHGACAPRRDGTPGGDEALDLAAGAAGYRPGVNLHRRPADWDRFGRRAGPVRNEQMAAECAQIIAAGGIVEGLALGALQKPEGGHTGTGHMVSLLRKLGVRVRWVPAPDAEAQILALQVCSARCGQGRDPDDLDITRAHGGPRGSPFAPSWAILRPVLDAREGAAVLRSVARTDEEKLAAGARANSIEAEAWAVYIPAFIAEMRQSYRQNRAAWRDLLARDRVVLRCRCADPTRCHRALLRERILSALGAIDGGELRPAGPRQLSIPGA